jgi:hypothetical protein
MKEDPAAVMKSFSLKMSNISHAYGL